MWRFAVAALASELDASNVWPRLLSCRACGVTLGVIPSLQLYTASFCDIRKDHTVCCFSFAPCIQQKLKRSGRARFAKCCVCQICYLQFWYRSFKSILKTLNEDGEYKHQVNWIMLCSKHNLSTNAPVFSVHLDILLFSCVVHFLNVSVSTTLFHLCFYFLKWTTSKYAAKQIPKNHKAISLILKYPMPWCQEIMSVTVSFFQYQDKIYIYVFFFYLTIRG